MIVRYIHGQNQSWTNQNNLTKKKSRYKWCVMILATNAVNRCAASRPSFGSKHRPAPCQPWRPAGNWDAELVTWRLCAQIPSQICSKKLEIRASFLDRPPTLSISDLDKLHRSRFRLGLAMKDDATLCSVLFLVWNLGQGRGSNVFCQKKLL